MSTAPDAVRIARGLVGQLKSLAATVSVSEARTISVMLAEVQDRFEHNAETFFPKQEVVIRGLQSRPELNGENAVIAGTNQTGRYPVKLSTGEVLNLKPNNLLPDWDPEAPVAKQSAVMPQGVEGLHHHGPVVAQSP